MLSNCSKDSAPEPFASFSMDKTHAGIGEIISFNNSSQNAVSYEWDFGDGHSSSDKNPAHSYSGTGEFTITLTANGEGGSDKATESMLIWDLVLESIFTGDSVQFQGPVTFKTQPVKLEFYNQGPGRASPNLVRLNDGYTLQDVANLFVNGVAYGHHPSWTTEIYGVWYFISADESKTWVGNLEPGLYTLVTAREDPYCVWYVADLIVTAD
jgi:PKD repeat protein